MAEPDQFSPRRSQIGDLKLRSSVAFAEPDAPAVSDNIMETAINVGEVYAQLARDLNEGTYRTPGFREALHNSSLIEAVKAFRRRRGAPKGY